MRVKFSKVFYRKTCFQKKKCFFTIFYTIFWHSLKWHIFNFLFIKNTVFEVIFCSIFCSLMSVFIINYLSLWELRRDKKTIKIALQPLFCFVFLIEVNAYNDFSFSKHRSDNNWKDDFFIQHLIYEVMPHIEQKLRKS